MIKSGAATCSAILVSFVGATEPEMLSQATAKAIVQRHVAEWNRDAGTIPLWVVLASPGDALNIPGVNFWTEGPARAGMEMLVNAHLIVLHQGMKPESLLSTFFHELGHVRYRRRTPKADFDHIDSEVAAIIHSLECLEAEGFFQLAHREAKAVSEMAKEEPYRSAVAKLGKNAVWVKYRDMAQPR